jgi:hypothetical protein
MATAAVYKAIEEERFSDAIELLERIRSPSALSVLGYCHFNLGNYPAAAEVYSQLNEDYKP